MIKKGIVTKMQSTHNQVVDYQLPLGLGAELIPLNPLVGKTVKLSFDGEIRCLDTGRKIKKSFGQGYSWESFNTLAACDECIFKPELCHYSAGTCREPQWGEEHCLKPHIVYLANSSELKVGITRKTQIPTRWIDQGATQALPIFEVADRHTSGLIEVELAKKLGDKTNWRRMLKNDIANIDLLEQKQKILEEFSELIKKYNAKILDEQVYSFNYPVETYPDKVSMLTLDSNPVIESKLLGIKGQYLIFEQGVLNIRRHQGYVIQFEA